MKVVTPRRPFFRRLAVLLLACAVTTIASAHTVTLRIVTYNIEDDINGATTPLPGLITPSGSTDVTAGGVLEGIGEEILGADPAQPLDIVALEETTGNSITVAPIVSGLNTYYGVANMYAMSTYQGTESGGDVADGNGPNAIVYNTLTLQLVASVGVNPPTGSLGSSSGEYRQVVRYEFAPAGVTVTTSNVFYIYVSHYKSGTTTSDLTSRGKEAVIIRNDEAAHLPADARVLYVGDYNVTTSGEASYTTMLAANSPTGVAQGGCFDASNITGDPAVNWGVNSLLSLKTESANSLRYRDDFQLMTSNIYYGAPGGLSLVPGTYHVFGNNGSTAYQSTVGSGNTSLTGRLQASPRITAAQLYQDLTTGSDHLPVVADYTVVVPDPAPTAAFNATPTNGTAPLNVTFTDTSTGSVTNRFWNFGDGATTNLLTSPLSHNYTNAGTFTVTEIVSNSGGSSTNTQTNLITVLTPYQAWQLQYFGCTNCPQSQTNAGADSTGGNNLFKFIVGLNPTNPAAVSTFQVTPTTNQPAWKNITFSPAVAGRTYTPQFSTSLGGAWQPLTTLANPGVTNSGQVTFTDTNATLPQEFYRVNISLP